MIGATNTLSGADDAYPQELRRIYGQLALPQLRYSGNIELLSMNSVGFCGSRRASDLGLEVTSKLSSLLAMRNIVVTSGYAKGVDTRAHYAALEVGGSTIIVLPEGISSFRVKRELASVWDDARVLVISQFPDDAVWRADRAMERNKIIVGMSSATVVIEAGSTGGTLDAGMSALRFGLPLFVASYADSTETNEGNKMLVRAGGRILGRNRETLEPNVDKIIEAFGFPISPLI